MRLSYVLSLSHFLSRSHHDSHLIAIELKTQFLGLGLYFKAFTAFGGEVARAANFKSCISFCFGFHLVPRRQDLCIMLEERVILFLGNERHWNGHGLDGRVDRIDLPFE